MGRGKGAEKKKGSKGICFSSLGRGWKATTSRERREQGVVRVRPLRETTFQQFPQGKGRTKGELKKKWGKKSKPGKKGQKR